MIKAKTGKRKVSKEFLAAAWTDMKEIYPDDSSFNYMPTNSVVLDFIWGGGIPRGKYVELASPSGYGKTTAALHIAKAICESGEGVLFIDGEKGLADSLVGGVGLTKFHKKLFFKHLVTFYADADEVLERYLIRNETPPSLVIIDSITSLKIKKAAMGKLAYKSEETGAIGRKSLINGAFLETWRGPAYEKQTTFLFINQTRTKMGGTGRGFKAELAPWGGHAMKFYMDVRTWMRDEEEIENKEGDRALGKKMLVLTLKHRNIEPRQAEMTVIFGKGINNERTVAERLVAIGGVERAGSWYKLHSSIDPSQQKVQGMDLVYGLVIEHFDLSLTFLQERGVLVP